MQQVQGGALEMDVSIAGTHVQVAAHKSSRWTPVKTITLELHFFRGQVYRWQATKCPFLASTSRGSSLTHLS